MFSQVSQRLRAKISPCPDNLVHRIGNQITYRLPVPDTVSDKGGRDIHHRRIHEFNIRMRLKSGWLRAGPRVYIESVVLEDSLVVFPLYEIDQVILAQDDLELPFGVFFRKVDERMDGITGTRQVKFDVGRFDVVIIIDSGANHVEAVEVAEKSFAGFERILRGNDEPHLVQIGGFRHDIRDDQVADMYRVEGAEEQTDFQLFSLERLTYSAAVRTGMEDGEKSIRIILLYT